METCILEIIDQVNVRFRNLDTSTRRKISEKLKFFVPYARHMPAFKLGRWDGKVSFCTVGGLTYLNLLDRIIPIIQEDGYHIEIDDKRPTYDFRFPEVTESLLADTCWPEGHVAAGKPIMLRDYQVEAIKRYLDNPQSIQSISTGAGKSQPLWSKIKVPGGWTTMGEIRPGDRVSTPDGDSARVVSIHPQGAIAYFRFTFEDGRTAEACGNHLWTVYEADRGVSRSTNPWRTMTTHEIIAQMARAKRPLRIQRTAPLGVRAELPIDPYVLGRMIGDGARRTGRSRPASHPTFVPPAYKEASPDQKRELLRGLMETDGTVRANGALNYKTASQQLANDVTDLVRSLGGLAWIAIEKTTSPYRGERTLGRDTYRVRIDMAQPKSLVSLPRKQDRFPTAYQYEHSSKLEIRSIEHIGTTECQCILIDHPDHLYITDNYVVTHNTLTTAALSKLVEPYGRSLVVVPSKSLVEQTEEDYCNLGLDVGVYYGDRKEWGKTHTISTWQSLVALSKKGEGREAISKMVEGTACVMVDECFAPGTPVLTPTGYRPIELLQPGDAVVNYDETNKVFKQDTVVRLHENLPASSPTTMLELNFDDGSIMRVTDNHRFLTTNGWKTAGQLDETDEIISFDP